VIAVACGSVVLIPSLALLFTLFLRGRLDTPEHHAAGESPVAPAGAATTEAPAKDAAIHPAAAAKASLGTGMRVRLGAAAVVGLVAGTGLLVFTDAPWTHVLGVAGFLLCAVAVFALTASPLDS
jgi:hypothetical protein